MLKQPAFPIQFDKMSTSTPYNMNMDPQTAKELVQLGATLLILDVPQGTYFGIDSQGFTVGPKFKGVKMLPPGPHFITYRSISNQGGASPASGFFLHVEPRQIIVKVWDPSVEAVVDMTDEDEAERYAAGVRRFDFDGNLAPYNMHAARTWAGLSSCITADHVKRLSPADGCTISIMAEATDPELMNPKTEAERKLVEHLAKGRAMMDELRKRKEPKEAQQEQPMQTDEDASTQQANLAQPASMDVDSGAAAEAKPEEAAQAEVKPSTSGRCRYTSLPRMIKQQGATAAELTALNIDKSNVLQQVLASRYGGRLEGLLGELQFAFIAFVYGQSLDSYAQWKALLVLLLNCEDAALRKHQAEFVKVLSSVRMQLETTLGAPSPSVSPNNVGESLMGGASPFGEAMVEELLPDSFLKRAFGLFFNTLVENGPEVGADLFHEASSLKTLLRTRLGWQYDINVICGVGYAGDSEADEDGPVVVEDPSAFVSL